MRQLIVTKAQPLSANAGGSALGRQTSDRLFTTTTIFPGGGRCDYSECSQKTFTIPLASVLRYARQTKRLQYHLVHIASLLGGRAGAKLASLLGMPTSRNILLRLLMQQPQAPIIPPKILGVDDWSIKKGTTARQPPMLLSW